MAGLATGGVAQRAECGGGGKNKTGAERQRKQTAAQRGKTLLGQGLRIPQDVAVVGYDNMVGIGDLFLPPLSTVQLPHYDIGRLSALHIIHGDNHRETRKVASPWLPRASH